MLALAFRAGSKDVLDYLERYGGSGGVPPPPPRCLQSEELPLLCFNGPAHAVDFGCGLHDCRPWHFIPGTFLAMGSEESAAGGVL